jgi:hypothetical protein
MLHEKVNKIVGMLDSAIAKLDAEYALKLLESEAQLKQAERKVTEKAKTKLVLNTSQLEFSRQYRFPRRTTRPYEQN